MGGHFSPIIVIYAANIDALIVVKDETIAYLLYVEENPSAVKHLQQSGWIQN